MVKIAITGANGRMGQTLLKLIYENKNTKLAGALVRSGNENVDNDTGYGVKYTDDAEGIFETADIVIDFCPIGATEYHLGLAKKHNTKLVIGTTGLDEITEKKIAEASKEIAIVYASNFSVGVNLMFALSEKAGKVLSKIGFETHIEETHHIHKLDAPSGTALSIGKSIAKGRGVNFKDIYKYQQSRTNINDLTFTDIRKGEVIGDHTVSFTHSLESFIMTHNAHDRSVFAEGAIIAALWLVHKKPYLYSMQNVLNI